MLNTKLQDTNYRAKVVKLTQLKKHPGADRLQLAVIDFQEVITGLDAKEGDLYVYFPLESQINNEFLSFTNSFIKKELNNNKEIGGFFHHSCRVKAIKLRSVLSEGYIHPVVSINKYLSSVGEKYQITEKDLGVEFDTIGDLEFCKKYVNVKIARKNRNQKAAKRESKLVDNQFRLHADTKQLKRNLANINLDDIITISYKIHGTSGIFSRVLCKKKLKWYEKILKKMGVNIIDTHYDEVFSSRRVIKNAYADKKHASFYDDNIWAIVNEELKGKIKNGITLYVEIAGYLNNGKMIQKDFDYGCLDKQHKVFVYRITYTSMDGDVYEFTTPQMIQYCEKFDLQTVPVFYHGKVINYFHYEEFICFEEEDWRQEFLEELIKKYNEKDCYLCNNKVPEEGAVISKEGDIFEAYKIKSERFYEYESKELDKGEENIEDNN